MTIKSLIRTETHFPINRKQIEAIVSIHLADKVNRDTEVSISVVGDRMMKKLNRQYRNLDKTTDVLSFTLSESKGPEAFVEAPDNVLRLGDVVVSYPEVVKTAVEDNKLVDDVIRDLVIHGLNHLLGIHHPE
jgi:probable rRNA maturation factor